MDNAGTYTHAQVNTHTHTDNHRLKHAHMHAWTFLHTHTIRTYMRTLHGKTCIPYEYMYVRSNAQVCTYVHILEESAVVDA